MQKPAMTIGQTTQSRYDHLVQSAFVAAILILLIIGALCYRGVSVVVESERWVSHTHEVLENLHETLLATVRIESSYRGFVLTGSEAQLSHFREDVDSIHRHEGILQTLVSDNAAQLAKLPKLESLTTRKINFAQTVVALRRVQGYEAAVTLLRQGQGPELMDQIYGLDQQLQREELRLLSIRKEDANRRLGGNRLELVSGFLVGFLIASAAAWNVHRSSRKRGVAEWALRSSERKFRSLLEAAPDAMVVLTQNGEIVMLNAETEQIFGYNREELLGQQVTSIVPEGLPLRTNISAPALTLVTSEAECAVGAATPASDPDSSKGHQEQVHTSRLGHGIELLGTRKGGFIFPFEVMVSPVEFEGETLFTAAIRDISERRKAEQKLIKTAEELKRSNIDLQQFAYVASHDLQEPLRMVASYTQLLSKRYRGRIDADADEFIDYAVDGCHRMKVLINDLLRFSRVSTQAKSASMVSVADALGQAVDNLRAAIEESNASITHDALPVLPADELFLVQVLQNLVGNALKYQGVTAPRIHIAASLRDQKDWIISVSDNGIGIEPRYFEKIFLIFQRLHARQDYQGTGMGLAICKKMVERLGGIIWVESELGVGSTFYFSLPAIQNPEIPSKNSFPQPPIEQAV